MPLISYAFAIIHATLTLLMLLLIFATPLLLLAADTPIR